jgi:Putative auto-transporter adhesin, head GIN domain
MPASFLRHGLPLLCAGLCLTVPAQAANKTFLVGSFDELVVDGDIAVILDNNKPPSAKATGDQAMLDAIRFESSGRQLRIRIQQYDGQPRKLGARAPLVINMGGRGVAKITANGSASVKVNQIRAGGGTAALRVLGSGSIAIDRLESDRVNLWLSGAGGITIAAGKSRIGQFNVSGQGSIDAGRLALQQANIAQRGGATTELAASDRVDIVNSGAGAITVTGKATCFVRAAGLARITCAKTEQK